MFIQSAIQFVIDFVEQTKATPLIQYPLEYSLISELSGLQSSLNLDENPPRLPTTLCFTLPVTAEIQSTSKGGLTLTILDNGQPVTLGDILTNPKRFEVTVAGASTGQMNMWLNKNPDMLNSILCIEIDAPQNSAWRVIPVKSSAIEIPTFTVSYRLYASDPLVKAESEHPRFKFLATDGSSASLDEFSNMMVSFFKQHRLSSQEVRCNAHMTWSLKEQSESSKQQSESSNEQLMNLVEKVKALNLEDIENPRLREIWTALHQGTKEELTVAEKRFVKRQLLKPSTESKNTNNIDITKLISDLSKQNRITIDSSRVQAEVSQSSRNTASVLETLNGMMTDRERDQVQEMVHMMNAMMSNSS